MKARCICCARFRSSKIGLRLGRSRVHVLYFSISNSLFGYLLRCPLEVAKMVSTAFWRFADYSWACLPPNFCAQSLQLVYFVPGTLSNSTGTPLLSPLLEARFLFSHFLLRTVSRPTAKTCGILLLSTSTQLYSGNNIIYYAVACSMQPWKPVVVTSEIWCVKLWKPVPVNAHSSWNFVAGSPWCLCDHRNRSPENTLRGLMEARRYGSGNI